MIQITNTITNKSFSFEKNGYTGNGRIILAEDGTIKSAHGTVLKDGVRLGHFTIRPNANNEIKITSFRANPETITEATQVLASLAQDIKDSVTASAE